VTHQPSVDRSGASAAERPTDATRSGHVTSVSDIGLKRALAVGEEAAFLWVRRPFVARSSALTFDVLARMDQRLSRLVYKLSEKPTLAEPFLQNDSSAFKSGLTFVTAIVALRGRVIHVFDRLLARLKSEPDLHCPLASALTWLDYSEVRPYVEQLLATPSPPLLRLGLETAIAHRVDPGRALLRAVASEAPALRAKAWEAVGRLAAKELRPKLYAALYDEDATCRFWAAWSAVRLGDRDGIPVLGRFAADRGIFAKPACEMALRALDLDQAVRAQQRLSSITGNERLAIVAAGIIGDPTLVSWLLDLMGSPTLARRAGAAFCLMTGCDLRRDDLDAERPSNAVAAPRDEPDRDEPEERQPSLNAAGERPEDEADDELPWPDTIRLRKWWDGHRQSFVPGVRYVAGFPIRRAEMMRVRHAGNQQQRAAAALELALLAPNEPMLDVTAPAQRQIEVESA
jgi:uncharacterized protein (TIGR02270 family)